MFQEPLNAVHLDEGEVAFIALQELLAAAAAHQYTTNFFFICSLFLLPLALDWSDKVLTVTI